MSDRQMYYDRQGKPTDRGTWIGSFEYDDRRVAVTKENGWMVSTVFLGLDHQWGDGPPLIFETMIFDHPTLDGWQERYSTEDEARSGHERAVALARSTP